MRRLQALAFAAFCLLSGSGWLVENTFPGSLPLLQQRSLHAAVVGLIALAIWLARSRHRANASWPRLAVAGVFLLGLPTVLLAVSRAGSSAGAALFALAPFFIVAIVAALHPESAARGLMIPALAGLAGAMLLLPFQLPSTALGAVFFALATVAVLATAGASVWLHGLLQGQGIILPVAVICLASAAVLAAAALTLDPVPLSFEGLPIELAKCLALDLPQLFLLVWLLRELPPTRLAARFLIVPLLTALEGLALLHPVLDLRFASGMLLLMAGGAALLFRADSEAPAATSSLGLRG